MSKMSRECHGFRFPKISKIKQPHSFIPKMWNIWEFIYIIDPGFIAGCSRAGESRALVNGSFCGGFSTFTVLLAILPPVSTTGNAMVQWKYHQIHVKRFEKSEYIYIYGSLKAFHLITSSNSEEVPTGPTQLQEVLANQVSQCQQDAFKFCCLSDR